MFTNETDDNKQYYEAQRLSDEILKEKSLPRKNYSQRVIELMQEKIEFFKADSIFRFPLIIITRPEIALYSMEILPLSALKNSIFSCMSSMTRCE